MWRLLFFVVGRRVAWLYGAVCFAAVAVLTALFSATSFGLAAYVSDQLTRLPWDIAILQQGAIPTYAALGEKFGVVAQAQRIETLGLLRIQHGNQAIGLEVNGKPLAPRWLVLIASTNADLLPPALRSEHSPDGAAEQFSRVRAVLIKGGHGDPSAIDITAGSNLRLTSLRPSMTARAGDSDEAENHRANLLVTPDLPRILFETTMAGPLTEIERVDFNKWSLLNIGSLSYIPEQSIVISVPMPEFTRLAGLFERAFQSYEGVDGQSAASPYLPEVVHLVRLERQAWLSPWALHEDLVRLVPLLEELSATGRRVTPYLYVNSPLQRLLTRMFEISHLIGLVTILVAIPLLSLSWMVGHTLSGLLVTNERRSVGLALSRGVGLGAIRLTILLALTLGGLLGGALGITLGFLLPALGYAIAGTDLPPASFWFSATGYLGAFLAIGIGIALLAGRAAGRRIGRLTPREVASRLESESYRNADTVSILFKVSSLLALGMGLYKVLSWTLGESLLAAASDGNAPTAVRLAITVIDDGLAFIAVPLLLAGIAGLVRWRLDRFQKMLKALAGPIAGQLAGFVTAHIALARARIAGTFFVTALATATAVLPQVAADGFQARAVRGVRASVGSDLQLEFNLSDLVGGNVAAQSVATFHSRIAAQLTNLTAALASQQEIVSVAAIEQYLIPDIYLPTQSGLLLDLLEAPDKFLATAYPQETLGMSRPLSTIIESLPDGSMAASFGFRKVRQVPLQKDIQLGQTRNDVPLKAQLQDVVAFLPGQPTVGVQQREGYADAELDYLNYVLSTDARIYADLKRFMTPPLDALQVLPSQIVLLGKTAAEPDRGTVERLVAALPVRPQAVRWQADERAKISRDMFASLALADMNVFVVGSSILAAAQVFIMSLSHFMAERRSYALLRLRGVPSALLWRAALPMFLLPVAAGVVVGTLLGTISGFGIAEAFWEFPRVQGAAGYLDNRLVFSPTSLSIAVGFATFLGLVAAAFAGWPLRQTAREAIRER